jgi:hypothetical protein
VGARALAAVALVAGCAAGKPPDAMSSTVSLPVAEGGADADTLATTAPPAPSSSSASPASSPDDVRNCGGACAGSAGEGLAKALELRAMQGKHCYDSVLRAAPSLEGHISIIVRVAPDGSVCSAAAGASTMPADMTECVLDRFRAETYPAPVGGCVDVTIPMRFKPKPPAADAGSSVPPGP